MPRNRWLALVLLALAGRGLLADPASPAPSDSVPAGWVLIKSKGKAFAMGQEFAGHRWTYTFPVHQVTFTYDLLMCATQVTQAEYKAVTGNNPSLHPGDERRPVDNVSWFDAVLYCNALSRRDGRTEAYNYTGIKRDQEGHVVELAGLWTNLKGGGYRLLTSAEYEFVVRAGTSTRWFFGDRDSDQARSTEFSWSELNSSHTTHPVGMLKANSYGVYDMTGNLWMWCGDWYSGAYPSTPQTDPQGPQGGDERVARGGAFKNDVNHERSAYHWQWSPELRNFEVGFRIARTVTAAPEKPLKLADINEAAWYRIIASSSGKGLALEGGLAGGPHGRGLEQDESTGADDQLFQFRRFQCGYYQIYAKATGRVLQVRDNSLIDHARIEESDPSGADNQLFVLVKDTDDSYSIIAKSSGYCFDVSGGATATGNHAQVIVYPANNALNHKFKLLDASLSDAKPAVAPLSVVPPYTPPFNAAAAGMTSLFDGRTLEGWVGDPACWRIVDGAIVGVGENQNIMTVGDYDDFRLVISTIQVNSPSNHQGVGFWGEHMPPGKFGYGNCIDIMPPMNWTWDYTTGHGARGRLELSRDIDRDLGITRSEWTQAEILVNRSKGTIRMAVNGIEVLYYTDRDPGRFKRGPIGLQAHAGNHDVRYKDIFIEVSPRESRLLSRKD